MSSAAPARPKLGLALRRALARQCPNCGSGKLFASYITPVAACGSCGEAYGHIRSDDAAPWLTILITGHIVVPLAVMIDGRVGWPDWASMVVWPGLTLVTALAVLPFAKATFIGMIWATKSPGSEPD
jgi:uncharacterized protein (DUF983 family)